jgi:hypothetical protein
MLLERAHADCPPTDSCLAVPLASPAALSAVRKTELRAWMLAQVLVLQGSFPTAVMLEANGLQDADELCRTLIQQAERTVSRFNAVTDDCRCARTRLQADSGSSSRSSLVCNRLLCDLIRLVVRFPSRVLGAGVALRVEGRILPTYNAVCALRDIADDVATDADVSPQSSTEACRLLTHAGMSIHEVCFMCSRLAEFGQYIAAADMLRQAGSASPEAQETVRSTRSLSPLATLSQAIHRSPSRPSLRDGHAYDHTPSAAFFIECEESINRAAGTRQAELNATMAFLLRCRFV